MPQLDGECSSLFDENAVANMGATVVLFTSIQCHVTRSIIWLGNVYEITNKQQNTILKGTQSNYSLVPGTFFVVAPGAAVAEK